MQRGIQPLSSLLEFLHKARLCDARTRCSVREMKLSLKDGRVETFVTIFVLAQKLEKRELNPKIRSSSPQTMEQSVGPIRVRSRWKISLQHVYNEY